MSLTLTPLPSFPLVQPGDDLPEHIEKALTEAEIALQDGDILVLAQKIVSKAEGRLVNLTTVTPGEDARHYAEITSKDPRLLELILSESREVLRTRENLVIVEHKLGFISANAGIDHSNVSGPWGEPEDWVLLLPEDPDRSAAQIRSALEQSFGCRMGVQIIDSHGRAWRLGTVGTTIGLAGMPGLVDLRGKADLFNYHLRATLVGAADELAGAASLMMGQAAEGTPVVHVRGFPYSLREGGLQELIRPKKLDMFR
ncbi:MAG: coenzyme F420-0:L-glutamate ligase [Chloroflexota bacterium]|nr:coenzyme F420-0:L-glutamate ligase [Chloroflexota bacterium]